MAARPPGMAFPPALARMLITRVRRSEAHVLDLADGDTRQLVAVVLDTIDNSSEAAELVILGRAPGAGADVVGRALDAAEALTLRGPRRRLLIGLPETLRD